MGTAEGLGTDLGAAFPARGERHSFNPFYAVIAVMISSGFAITQVNPDD
jgi:hypothetical protein